MTFDAILVPDEIRAAVSDRAWVEAMLEVERALVNAEALAGVVPAHLAGPIAEACRIESFDVEAIVEAAGSAGNPAEPLVRALREVVGGEAADYVHLGATSQDIVDSAAMLVVRRALRLIGEELEGVAAACAGLAQAHRLTPMAARTLLQQAVPTTFGFKAAGWLVAIVAARARLMELRGRLASQLGGAAGTLAALGADGVAVAGSSRPSSSWRAGAPVAFRPQAGSPSSARRSRSPRARARRSGSTSRCSSRPRSARSGSRPEPADPRRCRTSETRSAR